MPSNINILKATDDHTNAALVCGNATPETNDIIKPNEVASVKNVSFNIGKGSGQEDNGEGVIKKQKNNVHAIDEKLEVYKDYSHYGYNPENVNSVLNEFNGLLEKVLSENVTHVELAKKVVAMQGTLNDLTETLMTPEKRSGLSSKALSSVNKQEKIVRRLVNTFAALPAILLKVEEIIQLPENQYFRNLIVDEAVEEALALLPNGKGNEEWRQQLKENFLSPSGSKKFSAEVQNKLSYFFDARLQEAQNRARRAIRNEVQQIKKTADKALDFIGSNYCSADIKFADNIRNLVKVLDTFREQIEKDCIESKVMKMQGNADTQTLPSSVTQ